MFSKREDIAYPKDLYRERAGVAQENVRHARGPEAVGDAGVVRAEDAKVGRPRVLVTIHVPAVWS